MSDHRKRKSRQDNDAADSIVRDKPAPTVDPSPAATTAQAPAPANSTSNARMSSQMQAVVRLMTGREERTIQEKLADSNRPTWEQYKKDNGDKLNLEGVDQKQMEEYRRELDAERDSRLARGTNHGQTSKRKKKKTRQDDDAASDTDSDDDSRRRRRKHKKQKKKHKRKKERKRHRDDSDSDSDTNSQSETSDSDSKRKRRKKKHKKKREAEDNQSDGSHYRLSNFFTQGSDNDE
jgi:hypothetical protein